MYKISAIEHYSKLSGEASRGETYMIHIKHIYMCVLIGFISNDTATDTEAEAEAESI